MEEGRRDLAEALEENAEEENGISNRQFYPTFIPPLTTVTLAVSGRSKPASHGRIKPSHS